MILGSGFHGVTSLIQGEVDIPYGELPGFQRPAVPGHEGKLILGQVEGIPVAILSGRCHFYEGHCMEAVTFPVRVLAEAGIRDLVLTNAAGGINGKFRPGDFMLVRDHINFMGVNALRGPLPPGRERFIDMTSAYDLGLAALFQKAGKLARVRLREGVYVAVPGPCYETPAEIRAFSILGGDAVGMSTVPEVAVARQCGLRVAAISCITNLAAGRGKNPISHEEVLAVGQQSKESAARLLGQFIKLYAGHI
ncbi:MAG: inosine guanosine and xanthosine phosphorylase family [Verrucomicrobiales bacterium]|nr:inosine guanosine and xanthosine phosphorylase family [Verrucomicrobiales bacterium]